MPRPDLEDVPCAEKLMEVVVTTIHIPSFEVISGNIYPDKAYANPTTTSEGFTWRYGRRWPRTCTHASFTAPVLPRGSMLGIFGSQRFWKTRFYVNQGSGFLSYLLADYRQGEETKRMVDCSTGSRIG